jgi:hypothetical protein
VLVAESAIAGKGGLLVPIHRFALMTRARSDKSVPDGPHFLQAGGSGKPGNGRGNFLAQQFFAFAARIWHVMKKG